MNSHTRSMPSLMGMLVYREVMSAVTRNALGGSGGNMFR